jgi:hypothetical protein
MRSALKIMCDETGAFDDVFESGRIPNPHVGPSTNAQLQAFRDNPAECDRPLFFATDGDYAEGLICPIEAMGRMVLRVSNPGVDWVQ